MKKKYIWIVVILVLASGALLLLNKKDKGPALTISSFEECVTAGYPIMESYPEQCATPEKSFTRYIGNELEKVNLIKIENPRPNQKVMSPLTIKGRARGYWYFEGSFPARILDANDKELAVIPLQAKGEWMTEEFVEFEGVLTFLKPDTKNGKLILQKDNPSGLPENDDYLIVPITFE